MKAFEKWWKPSNEVMCYECGGYCKEDAKAVWREALIFALAIAADNQDDGTWHMILDELEE